MLTNLLLTVKLAMIALFVGLIATFVGMVQQVSTQSVFETDSTGQVTWQGTTP